MSNTANGSAILLSVPVRRNTYRETYSNTRNQRIDISRNVRKSPSPYGYPLHGRVDYRRTDTVRFYRRVLRVRGRER